MQIIESFGWVIWVPQHKQAKKQSNKSVTLDCRTQRPLPKIWDQDSLNLAI